MLLPKLIPMEFIHSNFPRACTFVLVVALVLPVSAGSRVNDGCIHVSNLHGSLLINPNYKDIVFNYQASCSVGELKVSQIGSNEATFSYIAHSSQVAEHGVCFVTEPDPMRISSKKVWTYRGDPIDLPDINTPFSASAEQLKPFTKYYARAYAKNSSEETFYSTEISFTTVAANSAIKQNNKDSLSGIAQDTSALREYRRFNGTQLDKYENENPMRIYNLSDGKLSGSYRFYNDKGKLISDQNFVDGEPNGYFRTYFESGLLRSDVKIKDGTQDGPTKEYFENGNLKQESNCSGPPFELTGQLKSYFENGKLKNETTVAQGKVVKSIGYDQEGRVIAEDSPGRSISYSYDRDGTKHVYINGEEQK